MKKAVRDEFKAVTGLDSAKANDVRRFVDDYRKEHGIRHDEPLVLDIQERPNNSPRFDSAVSRFCDFLRGRESDENQ